MKDNNKYQISIIGGGLAGLTLAIQMADAGISCILFEKNKYPFHKVCGEYISMESKGFIERLGLDLNDMDLPVISRLHVSSPSGKLLKHKLDLGGFGISRFLLDHRLSEIAKSKGVIVMDGCRVADIRFTGEHFIIDSEKGTFLSEICTGAWGKKSNLDTKLKRGFTKGPKTEKNYVGIKYHVNIDFPPDLIELHNFENGYCGVSKIEGSRYCLCYLSDSDNLKKYSGNIKKMEEGVLMKNPFLKQHLSSASFLFDEPLAISQIRIGYKSAVENNILMIGDTAGNIAPLSGNGMSMAMRSSYHLNELLIQYFKGGMSRESLENQYERFWKKQFKKRIEFSAFLQKMLKSKLLTDLAILTLKRVPFLRDKVVKSTHGEPF
ncbi:MAG TPA: NAD(P)/FAD-dependent oxidoreductase [Bacteroidia bacterium]|jgi:flavin-dependent dehydrogenase